jgi:hypothetical protein
MSTSVQCLRVNHMNVVLEDFDLSMNHFCDLYGAQFLMDLNRAEWHAGLFVIGRVLFELFAPHVFLLNARFGPHYLGVEYQVGDLDEARQAIAERGIRIARDTIESVHTNPADAFGVSFEFYEDNFHDAPRSVFREQMKPAEYWRDEHPLGVTGQKGYSIAVADAEVVRDFLQAFLGAEVRYDETRPEIGARAVGLEAGDAIVELLSPVSDGIVGQHLYRVGDGIRSTVFSVCDLGHAQRYFAERGITLQPGDAPDRLAIPAGLNRGIMFEFSE